MKLTRKVKVKNSLGLHIRPATTIVRMLQSHNCKVIFALRDLSVNAKSIMSLLVLSAQKNATITITVEGIGADEVMEMLVLAFENKFGEK